MELTFEAGSWWSYVIVFVAAATPVIEILVVVPAAVLAGMAPVPTALVAVVGNLSTVILVALAGDRLIGWWHRRRAGPGLRGGDHRAGRADHQPGGGDHPVGEDAILPGGGDNLPGGGDNLPGDDNLPSRRSQRARALAQRWGVPGLALLAPLTTGTHIATIAALTTGSEPRRVLWWMTAGLVLWAIAAAVVTAAGVTAFT